MIAANQNTTTTITTATNDINTDITPYILSLQITSIPLPTLNSLHATRLTLETSLTLLLQLDAVLRGDKAREDDGEKGNGFLDWVKWGPEPLSDRAGKVRLVEALVERAVKCDVMICDFFLVGGIGVEVWVLEGVIEVVGRLLGGGIEDVDEEGGDETGRRNVSSRDGRQDRRENGRDGREVNRRGSRKDGRQIIYPGSDHRLALGSGNTHLRISIGNTEEGVQVEHNDDDGPEEWEL